MGASSPPLHYSVFNMLSELSITTAAFFLYISGVPNTFPTQLMFMIHVLYIVSKDRNSEVCLGLNQAFCLASGDFSYCMLLNDWKSEGNITSVA